MSRTGIYIQSRTSEVVDWLETWARERPATTFDLGGASLTLGDARQRTILSQHLVVEIPATFSGLPDNPAELNCPVHFQILPVGQGTSTVAIGTTDIPELFPYLVEFASAASDRWPQAAEHIWFGEPPCAPYVLRSVTLPTTLPDLTRVLHTFAASFATQNIRSVSFYPTPEEPASPLVPGASPGDRHWQFRLALQAHATWQGIDHITLVCAISQTSKKKQPLALTLQCQWPPYRQAIQFSAAFIDYCRSKWPDTTVSYPESLHEASTAEGPAALQEAAPQSHQRYWTFFDRPWELIANTGWDRLLVELWWRDYPSAAIARHLGVAPKRVLNRLSDLRRIHGTGIVPTETQRRGKNWDKLGYLGS